MKSKTIIGLFLLTLLVLLVFGCSEKESDADNIQLESSEKIETTPSDNIVSDDEPVLPDDTPADLGDDITSEEDVSSDSEALADSSEDSEDLSEDTTDELDLVDEEGADFVFNEDGSAVGSGSLTDEEIEEEGLTADNYKVISLKDLNVYPKELHIKPGTTVEWRNINDNLLHIIGWTGQKQQGVQPEAMAQGESWSNTFNDVGEIRWFSTARPTIQGKIFIEAEEDQ